MGSRWAARLHSASERIRRVARDLTIGPRRGCDAHRAAAALEDHRGEVPEVGGRQRHHVDVLAAIAQRSEARQDVALPVVIDDVHHLPDQLRGAHAREDRHELRHVRARARREGGASTLDPIIGAHSLLDRASHPLDGDGDADVLHAPRRIAASDHDAQDPLLVVDQRTAGVPRVEPHVELELPGRQDAADDPAARLRIGASRVERIADRVHGLAHAQLLARLGEDDVLLERAGDGDEREVLLLVLVDHGGRIGAALARHPHRQ
ncbi:MAG: hypothetical protein M5U28_02765 [Sandaracinaceae bacterium]|nr:hypothetical protein [Sandaracinaceae bacterium]